MRLDQPLAPIGLEKDGISQEKQANEISVSTLPLFKKPVAITEGSKAGMRRY